MPSKSNARQTRVKLWKGAGGRCFYCHRLTILPEDLIAAYADYHPDRGQNDRQIWLVHSCPEFKERWASEVATIEHLHPLAAGGGWGWDNLALACAKCNNQRNHAFSRARKDANAPYRRRGEQPPGWRWSFINDCWLPEVQTS